MTDEFKALSDRVKTLELKVSQLSETTSLLLADKQEADEKDRDAGALQLFVPVPPVGSSFDCLDRSGNRPWFIPIDLGGLRSISVRVIVAAVMNSSGDAARFSVAIYRGSSSRAFNASDPIGELTVQDTSPKRMTRRPIPLRLVRSYGAKGTTKLADQLVWMSGENVPLEASRGPFYLGFAASGDGAKWLCPVQSTLAPVVMLSSVKALNSLDAWPTILHAIHQSTTTHVPSFALRSGRGHAMLGDLQHG